MIIDDDPVHHSITKVILKKNGLTQPVQSYFEADKAIDHLITSSKDYLLLPDIILLDINMPIMDGWQFMENFERFKGELNSLPAIYIFTSSITDTDRNKAKSYELVVGYIEKPVDTVVLKALLDKHQRV
jgi:CheY-like chemotaxis protein